MGDNITININSGTIVRTILFCLLVYALFFLKDLVLVILTAVVVASSVEPATRWFTQHKIPRVAAVILVYMATAMLLFGLFFMLVPPLIDDIFSILSNSPQYFDSIKLWNPVLGGQELAANFSLKEILTEFKTSIDGATGGVLHTLSGIFGGIFNFILIVVLSFYLSVQEHGIINFLRVITPLKNEDYVINLWQRTQFKIGLWMQGQLLLGLVVGVLVFLGLTILGVKYAFLMALLAAILELIPLFGPVIAAIPAVALGFADGGATTGLMVLGFYIIIQQFENHLIYPLVVKKVVGVPSLLVILALVVGAKLAGFFGIILSVPVAAALMEFAHDIENDKKRFAK